MRWRREEGLREEVIGVGGQEEGTGEGRGGRGRRGVCSILRLFLLFCQGAVFSFVLFWCSRVVVFLSLRFRRVLLCIPDGIGGGTSFDDAPF